MRKKLAAGGLAALGALALGTGATYAPFTSTVQGPDTLTRGGTLDLKLSTAENGVIQPISFQNLMPGDANFYHVQLTNTGTVAGKAFWAFDNVQELENGCVPAELAARDTCDNGSLDGELGDQLAVTLSLMPGSECNGTAQVVGPSSFHPSGSRVFRELSGLVLAPGASRCVRVDVVFQNLPNLPNQPNNNQAQSDSSSFGFRFQLSS